MNASVVPAESSAHLLRLVGFLDRDPDNMSLLADAVSVALDERHFDLAAGLIQRGPKALTPALLNLQGITALAQQRFADAVPIFEQLRADGIDDPVIRFNLAWAKSMTGDFAAAHDLLDDDAMAASPRAPSLKIQAMHHLELYEDALATGERLAQRYPDDIVLMGALATLAMDAEDVDLARRYAEQAGDNPEGLAVLGMLALDGSDTADALYLFERAIGRQQKNPRAWIGKGLGLVALGDPAAGAEALDHGAALFEDHLGSWIAAGWAHFMNKDYAKARADFERALAIDPNFSEVHGGLAVLDIVDEQIESAERHCEVALRLDRKSFGGALAKSLLLDHQGKGQAAQRIREIALSTPIGPDGRTIGQALIMLGGSRG